MATEKANRQRSCIGCGKQANKGDLFRVVKDAQGIASFDVTGREPGRGAYLCSSTCFATARKTKKLERALRCRLSEQDYERIAGEMTASGVCCN